jgi:hypothetical protein
LFIAAASFGGTLSRTRRRVILLAATIVAGCGGPSEPIDPGPTQSVVGYWSGVDETGALHFHINWVQNKRALTLLNPCVPRDTCIIIPENAVGGAQLGGVTLPVDLTSATGTLSDPGITFTVTTSNGLTFTFTGTVSQSIQMVGQVSGATHPSSRIVFDKQP